MNLLSLPLPPSLSLSLSLSLVLYLIILFFFLLCLPSCAAAVIIKSVSQTVVETRMSQGDIGMIETYLRVRR